MFTQAYIVTFFLSAIVLVIVIARNFFTEFAIHKDKPVPFFAHWVKFPSMREVVREEARSLLVGLYYIQILLIIGLALSLVFGVYTL